jgi:pimeloyl-ACP methyl ester carboxylesterase
MKRRWPSASPDATEFDATRPAAEPIDNVPLQQAQDVLQQATAKIDTTRNRLSGARPATGPHALPPSNPNSKGGIWDGIMMNAHNEAASSASPTRYRQPDRQVPRVDPPCDRWCRRGRTPEVPMIDTKYIQTAPGMVFDVSVAGPADGPLVLMLHGFGVSRYFWNAQVEALGQAGFLAAAPNQRGYAAGARPDPTDHPSYAIDHLISDARAIAAALGNADGRFHLAGHDWGASLAWQIADQTPEQIASLTILSRPHPLAFNAALNLPDGEQKRRSGHHTRFLDPVAGPDNLADDAKWLRTRLTANGVPQAAIERHLSVIGNPPAMEAALAWYRARGVRHLPVGPTKVPTLYIWGDADDTVGRAAAEGTGEFIAAPYRFEVIPGVGHYAADQVPDRVNALMLDHLGQHPA